MLTHYAYYNLSERTKGTINLQLGTIGFGAEAFVFAYIGISFFSYARHDWSLEFVAFEFFFVLISRFIGSVGLLYISSFIFRYKRALSFKEAVFLNFSGVIRGAIAFGLVLKLDSNLPNRSVIITTVLTLVISTTIIFGALMTSLKIVLLRNSDTNMSQIEMNDMSDISDHRIKVSEGSPQSKQLLDPHASNPLLEKRDSDNQNLSKNYAENKFANSFGEIDKFIEDDEKYKNKSLIKYFKRFDEFVMKPLLIYNYSDVLKKKKERKEKVAEKNEINLRSSF